MPASPRGPGAEMPTQPESVPPPRAQLGLAAPVTGRAPQKYLIQNQSGLKVYYWADKVRINTEMQAAYMLRNCSAEPRIAAQHLRMANVVWAKWAKKRL